MSEAEQERIAELILHYRTAFDDVAAFDRGEPMSREAAMTMLRMLPVFARVTTDAGMGLFLRQLGESWPTDEEGDEG